MLTIADSCVWCGHEDAHPEFEVAYVTTGSTVDMFFDVCAGCRNDAVTYGERRTGVDRVTVESLHVTAA